MDEKEQEYQEACGHAKVSNINGKWIARCGDNVVAEDTTEQGLKEQLNDLGLIPE